MTFEGRHSEPNLGFYPEEASHFAIIILIPFVEKTAILLTPMNSAADYMLLNLFPGKKPTVFSL